MFSRILRDPFSSVHAYQATKKWLKMSKVWGLKLFISWVYSVANLLLLYYTVYFFYIKTPYAIANPYPAGTKSDSFPPV